MTKKIKIKDLEDEPNLPQRETDLSSRANEKVEIDELHEDSLKKSSKPPVEKKVKKEEVKRKIEVPLETPVYFERNFIFAFITKAISTSVVIFLLEIVSHGMKYFEGVDVKNVESYHSLFFSGNTNLLICKIVALIIFVYFITNKSEIKVNEKGIFCTKGELVDKIFFSTKNVFIPWGEVKKVKLKMRLFEPYLFFYGNDDEVLGYLEFSVDSKDRFFNYIEKNAGRDHPLQKAKEQGILF